MLNFAAAGLSEMSGWDALFLLSWIIIPAAVIFIAGIGTGIIIGGRRTKRKYAEQSNLKKEL